MSCVPTELLKNLCFQEKLGKTYLHKPKPLTNYLQYMRELDLVWLTTFPWNVNVELMSDSLEAFMNMELLEALAKFLWTEYGHRIHIELVSFKLVHSELINRTCHRLQTLKIAATVVDDLAVATVISHQASGVMRKLVVSSMESYCIHRTIDALDRQLFNTALSKIRYLKNITSLRLAGWKHASNEIRFENVPFDPNTCEAAVRAAGRNLLQVHLTTENQELGNTLALLARHCPNITHIDIQKMRFLPAHLLEGFGLWHQLKSVKLGNVESVETHIGDQIVNGVPDWLHIQA
ncbi:hypothetical protein K493DRAFT_344883 [Basidiobolus meristosporus CBS 931.73]|uniref:RNI-like protein n=1 Tax=Basidiobolus meristosporus CBS 931.73 TaxID=1314790 RepID=A0A1Y1Z5M6_9FUNG|nr:hypothetical protein K493DRAFT_344883 [Basidiobolus meristosporus CBS 931.73]|eukprot:ORY05598.1 hypothetical protein K493DRAFT_344883 [Basidiobolus meristosporus CBS 931.73]